MSQLANTDAIRLDSVDPDLICRDDFCQREGLHPASSGCQRRRCDSQFRTRSKRYASAPWRVAYPPALHESVRRAISRVEARTFSMIVSSVENDYGSCCQRSVHRHLCKLRWNGDIIRLDFKGRLHAYLEVGSPLATDPDLVYEQIMDTYSNKAA